LAVLIDTNILVYRFDGRDPRKQTIATELLRARIADDSARVPHQALVEFVSATTRVRADGDALLTLDEARREVEDMLNQFTILYPNEQLVRLAVRGSATYGLSWFDAHIWAYAEYFGLEQLLSEDFQHGRYYGSVHAHDPFVVERP
jgi:predicted nucleic acid-binding protein